MIEIANGYQRPLGEQMALLREIVMASPLLCKVLEVAEALDLPDWYVGAGCVTQCVWNAISGQPHDAHLKDIDLVYFDPAHLDGRDEKEHEARLRERLPRASFPMDVDVKNQARVHLWYADYFGYPIPPYTSVEAAIATWPTTASSLGVRVQKGRWDVVAPFGLNDLFGLIVRPNKAQITQEIYEAKARRWKSCWPELEVMDW